VGKVIEDDIHRPRGKRFIVIPQLTDDGGTLKFGVPKFQQLAIHFVQCHVSIPRFKEAVKIRIGVAVGGRAVNLLNPHAARSVVYLLGLARNIFAIVGVNVGVGHVVGKVVAHLDALV
jgi:hypothetical protein